VLQYMVGNHEIEHWLTGNRDEPLMVGERHISCGLDAIREPSARLQHVEEFPASATEIKYA